MSPLMVSGRVVGPDGAPVAGAAVYVARAPVALPDIAQLTGPDGRFSFPAPVPGHYRIGVNAPGWPPQEHDVHLVASPPASIEIRIGRS